MADIKPEQIPPDVWVAATIRLEALGSAVAGYTARDVIAAALSAWPGMTWACRGAGTPPHILFLPLPAEASDEPV